MKVNINYINNKVVLQPTTTCNLNCSYCYLPGRKLKKAMKEEVCETIANYIEKQNKTFEVIWHGGEPLACGLKKFETLISKFNGVNCRHSLQTNGTLIDDTWCKFFLEYDINVGLSLDGDEAMNHHRVNWSGKPAFKQVMKGIEWLKKYNIPFSIISVITDKHLDHAEELYNYFSTIGCWSWGLNLEETEGAHRRKIVANDSINRFWSRLFSVWKADPKIRIREFDYALTWMDRIAQQPDFDKVDRDVEIFPTISCDGNMVLLSPEFVDLELLGHDFIVGNVLNEPMDKLLSSVEQYALVNDFSMGIRQCAQVCSYFSFCGGGYASNKFFENGTVNSSQTQHCMNTKINLIDTIIKTI